jgi:hypothetical protein
MIGDSCTLRNLETNSPIAFRAAALHDQGFIMTPRQDGTPTHPYVNASQCALSTDLVFWPNGPSTPSMPADISVCFVRKLADQR